MIDALTERVQKTQHGFTDIKKTADELVASQSPDISISLAYELFKSEVPQARMLATFIFGRHATQFPDILIFMREHISRDTNWRVQEILAMAFDQFCADTGYEKAFPIIQDWLADGHHHVRRAVTEGLRIWTSRPYFDEHPEIAIQLLSQLHADDSEYVRKSVGNALRDISRKHPDLIREELSSWDRSSKKVAQVYKLASRLLVE
ncbi:MAG: DNA alkylation repair protein [Chloroflexi bacterium]|nr:DNA alkylation repair protein [Chloroflexota bacterium]